ncbi:MAG: protein kinase [Kiritimatiellae bacterium]|nr:protein kinase [Kiritimatiellia bacterium]
MDKPYSILIVDDEEDIIEMLSAFLAELPHEVLTAQSSSEAIEILNKKEIAVLICDLHMADELDGNDILSVARAANGDIVSILMSGSMDRNDMITALNTGGVSRYLEKPLHVDEVISLVEEGIDLYTRQSRPQERLKALARQSTIILNQDSTSKGSEQTISIVKRESLRTCNDEYIGERYELQSVIGEGRAGIVYRAKDLLLHTSVALKVLHPHLTAKESEVATLKEEARIAMSLSHRNIVRLHTFDEADSKYFLVMEYVDGCTVRDVLVQDKTLPPDSTALIIRSCASAIAYAHEHEVIHQDLKPENILLSSDGTLKIIDFGLACLAGRKQQSEHIAGTPIYMSPQQKNGEPVDTRTDIYSLGIIAYELLTGKTPFPADTNPIALLKMAADPITGTTKPIALVLEKAIAPDPNDRWSSVSDFAVAYLDAIKKMQNE